MAEFYRCNVCGKIVTELEATAAKLVCCGEEMEKLTAKTVDAAKEKHVPAVNRDGDKVIVQVGSVLHPMEKEHHISFVALETDKGLSVKYLKENSDPVGVFKIAEDEKIVAVYEYCNIHGLWKYSN